MSSVIPINHSNVDLITAWCVYITFPNGKRYRKIVGTKKQAEEVHRKLKNELVEGRWDLWENEDVMFSDSLPNS